MASLRASSTGCTSELKARLNDQPHVHASGAGGQQWTPPYADAVVRDGDEVKIGALRLKAQVEARSAVFAIAKLGGRWCLETR